MAITLTSKVLTRHFAYLQRREKHCIDQCFLTV